MMQITEIRCRNPDMSGKLLETSSDTSNIYNIMADILNGNSFLSSTHRRLRHTCDKCRKTYREIHSSEILEKAVT
jgi:hypothetical protein